ncbi:MAG TPA: hypothetical protein VJV79_27825 [Polyangiaceae bacterium]|nr:hypothetical protein [Polyangiaceae bacterium]
MNEPGTDPLTVAVWIKMADHFLDTETRHELPLTALCCVQAGLSPARARQIWQYEVSPAVGFNLNDIGGEWAYWDAAWLVNRIVRARASSWNRPGLWRRLRSPLPPLMSGQWLAIERCIQLLHAVPSAAERERMASDLARLARHSFDFYPEDLSALESHEREQLRRLYPAPFQSVLGSALLRSERADAERRVQGALSGIEP